MNKIGNQYLKQVKSHLTCPGKLKKTFLTQLRGDVEEFLETNPNATLEDLAQRFGSPSEMAHSYIETLDGDELQKQIKKAKIVKRIVLFTCLGILTVVLVIAVLFIIHFSSQNISVVTYTASEDETIIVDESIIEYGEAITDGISVLK